MIRAALAALVATLTLCPPIAAQDILILGEIHDNPHHHAVQAREVAALEPAALVFEMLTPAQADGAVFADAADQAALDAALGWTGSGWPDFSMYHPIFAAAVDARIYGAGLPRDAAMAAMETGAAGAFGAEAALYGLTEPLPETQQAAREALQFEAHCEAMPMEMMAGMVEVQRLRDAMLARAALRAYRDTGGPVAVITGNGHARPDWGVPALIARVAPKVEVVALGQAEAGRPLDGGFDRVLSAPVPERGDPCEAFR